MTTLHDRLTTLAERADDGSGPPAHGLWSAGRRLHRLRRLGSMAIVATCCLLLASLGVADWQRTSGSPDPASGGDPVAIPAEFHEPSKWLPGTEGEPWDRLVAVRAADRGEWFGTRIGFVGVSASTGEYRFLDLPDQLDEDRQEAARLSLSHDGRYVAYWFAEPSTIVPDDSGTDFAEPAAGYVVYDVVRGETVLREPVESPLGLLGQSIQWTDDHTVAFSFSEILEIHKRGETSKVRPARVHDLRTASVREFPARELEAGGGGWLLLGTKRLTSVAEPDRVVRLVGDRAYATTRIDDSGARAAAVRQRRTKGGAPTNGPSRIVVASIEPTSSTSRFEPVPGDRRYDAVVGWRDERTVVATRLLDDTSSATSVGNSTTFGRFGVFAVDVETGEETLLTDVAPETDLATGVLDAPVVDRPAPPWLPGLRLKAAGAVAILLLGGVGLLVWRRRVGP
jgi:hypothetical protein